jgi:hypothetical protein
MIRNLKVLLAAAMALGALASVGVAGAQAEPLFHCSAEPCKLKLKPDETAGTKTAHQVLIFKNTSGESLSFTCNQLDGTATSSTKTFTTATVTGLEYTGCILQVDGSLLTVRTNGCDYTFTSHGKFGVSCPESKKIEVEITKTGCLLTIGTFADLEGITYHNLGSVGSRQITISTLVRGIPVTADGTTAQCFFDVTKTPLTAEYTTGNTIAEAQTDPGGVKIDGWWE